jgi:hypothetical protein
MICIAFVRVNVTLFWFSNMIGVKKSPALLFHRLSAQFFVHSALHSFDGLFFVLLYFNAAECRGYLSLKSL